MSVQKWSEAQKKLVILELLQGKKSVIELAKEHGMSDGQIYKWKDQALLAIDTCFQNKEVSKNDFSAERDKLLKIIGEQACVIDTLKKISEIRSPSL
jgi:transposase-like protein